MTSTTLPTYFISHGGGPWPYMKEQAEAYKALQDSLQKMPQDIGSTPTAILMVSAHWREKEFTVSSGATPAMIYDYGGFPEHTYHVKYPAPGAPALAQRVQKLIADAGMTINLDENRGYDHGTFVPLAVMFPAANVPVVQLAIRKRYEPALHLALGRALAPLRREGVLIVGSGLSYHNLGQFDASGKTASADFDQWLQETLLHTLPNRRSEALCAWSSAPQARSAHPREDHLIPLMVALGAAEQEQATCVYHEKAFLGALTVSSFRFG